MREFAFTISFEEGADALMDVFIAEPRLRTQTRQCFAHDQVMWRIEDVYGPTAALERFDALYFDEGNCNECLDTAQCDSTRDHQILDQGDTHRVIYTHRRDIGPCHSIPTLALEEIGDGVVLEASRQGNEYEWIVLMPDATPVGQLFDRVNANLREGLSLELSHLTDLTTAGYSSPDRLLSPEEQNVLETAIEEGYYGIPRETTVSELADTLETPRSTVQHRLQRAEATIVEDYARTFQ